MTNVSTPLKYFLTYKVSRDHIELYFCCIRSRGGWNNNPSVLEALWSIRRLLYRNSITPSINANCLFDYYDANPIFQFRSKNRDIIECARTEKNIIENKDDVTETVDLMQTLVNIKSVPGKYNNLYCREHCKKIH